MSNIALSGNQDHSQSKSPFDSIKRVDREGCEICIEKEKEYFDIACDRISQPREYSESELKTMELKQLSLFDVT